MRTVLLWKAEILLLSFPCTFDLWEGEEEVEEEEEKEKEGEGRGVVEDRTATGHSQSYNIGGGVSFK